MKEKYKITHDFIKNRWKDGLRTKSNPEYPLPFPFEPPCVDGQFQCMFYWDTYYTNKGLILDNHLDYAKYNTDNLLYLCNKYGFVPNSNSYPGVKHNSQPPYLHFMVMDIYQQTHDDNWLKEAYFTLKKEYNFWMKERITPCGLNRYYHHPKTEQECIDFYDYVATRLELDKDAPREIKIKQGSCLNCDCESGLDFSPRFALEGEDIVEVDLNAILYSLEGNLAFMAEKFEPEMVAVYKKAQARRKQLIDSLLYDPNNGLYWDYNYVKKQFQQKEFNFTGQFFPYIVGLSKDKGACKRLLSKLEYQYGIASTSPYSAPFSFQAAYPYSWPYDNGITFWALTTLGMKEDAIRMGNKYLEMCSNSYTIAGHLWETYNAIEDGIATKKEYPNQEMLGWTAGIYQWIYNYTKEQK